jgi:hypothetical protein
MPGTPSQLRTAIYLCPLFTTVGPFLIRHTEEAEWKGEHSHTMPEEVVPLPTKG